MKFTVKNYTPTTSTLQSEDYLYSLQVVKEHADRICKFLNGEQKEDPEVIAQYFTGDQLIKFQSLVTILGLEVEVEEAQGEVTYPIRRYNKAGQKTYHENSDGDWKKWKYNKAGKQTHYEDSTGFWWKQEYNKAGKRTYFENSNGYWKKWEYNEAGKKTYYEDSTGFWWKQEYNEAGQETYYETSTGFWQKQENNKAGLQTYWGNSDGYCGIEE